MMSQGCALAHARRATSPRSCLYHYIGLCLAMMPWTVAGCQAPDQAAGARRMRAGPLPELSVYSFRYADSPPVFNVGDLKSFLREYRQHVVILDVWASWSRPSREELSMLADLNDELFDQGLRVVAVNLDPPEEWTSRTVPTLLGAGANFPCVLIRQEAREELRQWLAPDWNYDLPARFILDRRGRIIARSLSSTPIAAVLAEARQQVLAKQPKVRTVARRRSPRVNLGVRLVNVATGEWESLPLSSADSSSPARLAGRIVSYISTRLDRSRNERIAILPFLPSADRRRAGTSGTGVAEEVRRGLRKRGFFDLIGTNDALRLISQAGISATAIDYDPSIVRGRLAVDYLVIGRVARGMDVQPGRRALAATDNGNED